MHKLSLPNELTNDGYFCAYTLRYFINEHIIRNNLSSADDIKLKIDENVHLLLIMINRAIVQGCYHFKYNKNEEVFLKACKELYEEIIRQKKDWDPNNPNSEYFKVQNKIAMGEASSSFNYLKDGKIDRKIYEQMKKTVYQQQANKVDGIKNEMHTILKDKGFTDEQIQELIALSFAHPEKVESRMKEMLLHNEHFADSKYVDEDTDNEKIDVDSFLEELGLQ